MGSKEMSRHREDPRTCGKQERRSLYEISCAVSKGSQRIRQKRGIQVGTVMGKMAKLEGSGKQKSLPS